jgi:hypothetical protein
MKRLVEYSAVLTIVLYTWKDYEYGTNSGPFSPARGQAQPEQAIKPNPVYFMMMMMMMTEMVMRRTV